MCNQSNLRVLKLKVGIKKNGIMVQRDNFEPNLILNFEISSLIQTGKKDSLPI